MKDTIHLFLVSIIKPFILRGKFVFTVHCASTPAFHIVYQSSFFLVYQTIFFVTTICDTFFSFEYGPLKYLKSIFKVCACV